MGFLCKEQVMKGLYLSIGNKYRIPKDILLIIYRIMKDDSMIRQYHMDAIYRNTIPNYSSSSTSATGSVFTTSTKFPLGRGIEWAIKWEKNGTKKVRHIQIQVFSEKDYLLKRVDYVDSETPSGLQYFLKRSHNKLKLLYLKKSPMDEVFEDYSSYLEADRQPEYRLCIDDSGEAIDFIGPNEVYVDVDI